MSKSIEAMSIEELQAALKAKKAAAVVSNIEGATYKLEGNTLTIVIADVTKVVGESKSGKSDMIATTHGFAQVGGGLTLSLNLTKSKK